MHGSGLAGRRVLELGGYLASPFAGRILAQLGADVVKVESLTGDATRHLKSPGTFVTQNMGKRSLALDLRSADGRAVFDRLLETADVVLHNLSREAVSHLKLTAEACREVNSDLVYCHITGYGPGPLEYANASNPIIEASMGVMFNNRVDGRPTRLSLPYYDMAAGAMAVVGILAALSADPGDKASRTVEVPLYELGLYLSAAHVLSDQIQPPDPKPTPGRSDFAMPGYGAYETADGRWMYLLMLTDANWRQFCDAMALADRDDPALGSGMERRLQPQRVEDLVRQTIKELTYDEAATRLRTAGFGFDEVRPPNRVLDHQQARDSGRLMLVPVGDRSYEVPSFPILSGLVQTPPVTSLPELGEHTLELLDSLGYDRAQCDDLVARGVIASSNVD